MTYFSVFTPWAGGALRSTGHEPIDGKQFVLNLVERDDFNTLQPYFGMEVTVFDARPGGDGTVYAPVKYKYTPLDDAAFTSKDWTRGSWVPMEGNAETGLVYITTWDASSGSAPDITNADPGHFWVVNVNGNTQIPTSPDGSTTEGNFLIGDWIIYSEDQAQQPYWTILRHSSNVIAPLYNENEGANYQLDTQNIVRSRAMREWKIAAAPYYFGDTVWIQKKDENGDPIVDEDGNPAIDIYFLNNAAYTPPTAPGGGGSGYSGEPGTPGGTHWVWIASNQGAGGGEVEFNDDIGDAARTVTFTLSGNEITADFTPTEHTEVSLTPEEIDARIAKATTTPIRGGNAGTFLDATEWKPRN